MSQAENIIEQRLTVKLQKIVELHFDPIHGSPYWIEKASELGLDATKEIRRFRDLAFLGPMDETALAERPIEDFIPRSLLHRKQDMIFAETAGTTGNPKFTVHLAEEFHAAFIEPFVKAANCVRFPQEQSWLFIGPTGPHIIGKAARASAASLGSPDIFTVDFDPRWAKKLIQGSFASKRYLEHIESQAIRVLDVQNIGVIFSTPVVLDSLADKISVSERLNIKGIHLGGMSASAAFMDKLAAAFPNAVILSGYGNTLFGMMPQLNYTPESGFDYYPHGNRLIVNLVEYDPDNDNQHLEHFVDYGQRGQIIVHRLDQAQFIPNMVERDTAVRIAATEDTAREGFGLDGIRDPMPIVSEKIKPVIGLY